MRIADSLIKTDDFQIRSIDVMYLTRVATRQRADGARVKGEHKYRTTEMWLLEIGKGNRPLC